MPSRRAFLAGLGAASAGLAGCNWLSGRGDDGPARQVPPDWAPDPGEWGGPTYDQANSGHNHHATPPGPDPTVAWADDRGRGTVLVADGTVFHRESGSLRGLDVEDGAERFEVSRLSGSLYRYVDGRLYDRTIDGLDALTLEGEPVWDDPIVYGEEITGLVEREGYVFLATRTDTVHHHDADTGARVDATVHDVAVRGLANHDGALYAALADGLAAYDVADDGSLEQLYRRRLGGADGPTPRSVAVGSDRAYVIRRRGRRSGPSVVSMFDVDDGEHVGSVEFDDSAWVAAVGEYAYVTTIRDDGRVPSDGGLAAYDDTEQRWSIELDQPPAWSVLADGTLFVGTGAEETALTVLDAESGDELWTYEGAFPEAVVDETIYAVTDDDRFVALRD